MLLWSILLWTESAGYLIASGSIESCTDSGSALNCTSGRMLVSLSLESGQAAGSERLEAYVTAVSSTAQGSSQLRYPIKVQASKTQATARYPLRYQQDYNNKPRELVQSLSAFECSDEAYASNPSCGWKVDTQGQRIWDSQGYCCECSLWQTIGLDPDEHVRGNQCQDFNLGSGYATAHCLVLDDLWYSAYEVGTHTVGYNVQVDVTIPDSEGNYTLKSVIVSPSVPVQQVDDVIVRLIGDFYPATPPPDLSSLLLFTPSFPSDNTRVLMGSRRWMLLSPSQVTTDGTECNKVGTSYVAFNSQGNKCGERVQSCFQNQPDDLDSSDLLRVNNGQRPNYFLSAWGNFTTILWQEQKYLELSLTGRYTSLITLEMSADRLVFITSVSTGKIDYAYINSFESQSWDGLLSVQVTSTGTVTAQFSLTINCTTGVSPIPAELFTLPAHHSVLKTFPITVEQQTGQSYNCSVILWDAVGEMLEILTIGFNTTNRHTDLGAQGGNGEDPDGSVEVTDSRSDLTCTDYCPNWFDLPCFFAKGCWTSFLRFLGILLLLSILLLSLKFIIRRYGCCCHKLCTYKGTDSRPSPKPQESPSNHGKFYYNFHYGVQDLGLFQRFSAIGSLVPVNKGKFEFHIEDEVLIRLIHTRKTGSTVLQLSTEEANLHLTSQPCYPQLTLSPS